MIDTNTETLGKTAITHRLDCKAAHRIIMKATLNINIRESILYHTHKWYIYCLYNYVTSLTIRQVLFQFDAVCKLFNWKVLKLATDNNKKEVRYNIVTKYN